MSQNCEKWVNILKMGQKFENVSKFWNCVKILKMCWNFENGSNFKNWERASCARHMRVICASYASKFPPRNPRVIYIWRARQMRVKYASYMSHFFRASFTNDARASMRVDTHDSTGALSYLLFPPKTKKLHMFIPPICDHICINGIMQLLAVYLSLPVEALLYCPHGACIIHYKYTHWPDVSQMYHTGQMYHRCIIVYYSNTVIQ